VQEPETPEPRPFAGDDGQEDRTALEIPGRSALRLDVAELDAGLPSPVLGETVGEPEGEARPDDLPVVPDRLKIPKPERAAYDDGFAAGMNGWEEKTPRRFQQGQRLAHLLPFRLAGYRDGAAKRRASVATAEAASEVPKPPPAV
jgi:hypothetical protein